MFTSRQLVKKDTKDIHKEGSIASSPVLVAPNNSPIINDKQNQSFIPQLTLSIPDQHSKTYSILAPKSGNISFNW